MSLYAQILLPLPLQSTFTYAVPTEMAGRVKPGHRVLVPFGRRKFYTGIVTELGNTPPEGNYDVKEIVSTLDDQPIIRRPQMQLWNWIADYYLCSAGDVLRAALPAALKVESETFIEANPDFDPEDVQLTERETIILQVLSHEEGRMKISEIEKSTGFNGVGAIATAMLEKGAVIISEKLVERYRSRKVTYVRLTMPQGDNESLREAFEKIKTKAQVKQQQTLQTLVALSSFMQRTSEMKEVSQEELMERSGVPRTVLKQLADKGIVEFYKKEINRFQFNGTVSGELPTLSDAQDRALKEIHRSWFEKDVTLLHGVTSSGKTEIYIHLIDYVLKQRRQALFLVPEIALTTQLTKRLQRVFGEKVVIYHSKFTDNERVDIYRKVLSGNEPMVVIGARSSLFLPFASLGLVIVDEEHEPSYKQQDPAPRYNGRDTAMVLARMHGAKVLLGSATPAIDTYYKAQTGRYGLVTLSERYSGVELPEIRIIDTALSRKRKTMRGALSQQTIDLVHEAVDNGKQAIVFLNRRGYAPMARCKMCAFTPKCDFCDVSLTYHRRDNNLQCHYCGAQYSVPSLCPECKEPAIEIVGYGTERLEDEITECFRDRKILRMDLDTTRNKEGYGRIIDEFSQHKADILVGTQMVTKGLDFGDVELVGVLNADSLINFPDFRSAERAFNMIEQVAGRAGRRDGKGSVLIQTYKPDHPILQFILSHDYKAFYEHELEERRAFNFPPFSRIINIYVKHREASTTAECASILASALRKIFGTRVCGPQEPNVSRVQSLYIRKIMLKVETGVSMKQIKQILRDEYIKLSESPLMRSLTVYYDVDP